MFETVEELLNSTEVFSDDFMNSEVHGRAVAMLAARFAAQARALMKATLSVSHPETDEFSPLCGELGINPWGWEAYVRACCARRAYR